MKTLLYGLSKIAPTVSTDKFFKFKDTMKMKSGKVFRERKEAEDLLKKYDDKVAAFQKDGKQSIKMHGH